MKIGSKLQYQVPDHCPKDCPELREPYSKQSACHICPIFICSPKHGRTTTQEEQDVYYITHPKEFDDKLARDWSHFFKGLGKK